MFSPPKTSVAALIETTERKKTPLVPVFIDKRKLTILSSSLAVLGMLTAGTTVLSQPQQVNTATDQQLAIPQTLVVDDAPVTPEFDRDSIYTVYVEEPEVKPEMIESRNTLAYVNNTHWDVQYPFPVGVPITSTYGPRPPMCSSCKSHHDGADFGIKGGTPIQPIAAGRVVSVGWAGSYGFLVVLEHVINGQYITSYYAHLEPDSSPLKPGDTVKKGSLLGLVGNTGVSTDYHLHLEIRLDGTTATDPLKWLEENSGSADVGSF